MKTSLSFDRAAGFYDRTREFAEPVATLGIEAILNAAGRGAHILDVGTGSGRVSVPLLKRGADLVGCDISLKMMSLLHQKYPAARLTRADASLLPFPSHEFGAVITCHVMHLVGPWPEALREYRRVLKGSGVYINARTEHVGGSLVERRIKDFWESRIIAYGASAKRPGVESEKELHAELQKMGAVVEQLEVVRYPVSHRIREDVEAIANRIHSHTWSIPDDILAASVRDLHEWLQNEYGAGYLEQAIDEEAAFVLDLVHFES